MSRPKNPTLYSAAAASRAIGCSAKAVQQRLESGIIVRGIDDPPLWDRNSGAFRLTRSEVEQLRKVIASSRQFKARHRK